MWRPAVGFNGRYEVSNCGQIRSVKTTAGGTTFAPRKPQNINSGYLVVKISDVPGGTQKTKTIHSLVAEAFLGERPRGAQVNHKDGDRTNNHVVNLEWVTPGENIKDSYDRNPDRVNGRSALHMERMRSRRRPQRGELHHNAKLSETQASQIIKLLIDGQGVRPIAREFGISHTLVRAIKTRTRWSHLPWE